jgi:hypothetical protein
MGRASKK